MRPLLGRLNAITRLISVLLPEPLEPTSAVVVPGAAWNDTFLMTGMPSLYSNHTSSKRMSPRISPSDSLPASASSSVCMFMISRMRSRPANASVICVPMLAIEIIGAASSPMKKMYITKSPSVMRPATMSLPPIQIITTPTTPMITVLPEVVADTPVIDCAILRNRRCAP
jgi:hypothetical protein